MRKVKEILRLRYDLKRTHREIAVACNISPSTVGDCVLRFRLSSLSWPLPAELDDQALEERLYHAKPPPSPGRPAPDWSRVHAEMGRKHVTLSLLWQEYKQAIPDGYQYSWFCRHYSAWCKCHEVVMRQEYKLGEKCQVDYAGDTIPVISPLTGEIRQAQLFVGALAASNYTYAEASWSQDIPSWISAHVRMFEYYGALPTILVPDNLKSGVTKPDYYEPDINLTYQDMANHYEIAVIPARVRKSRDKAKVENAVLVAERWILAKLRDRVFFGLEELNCAIRNLLDELNCTPFQKLPGSRREAFEQDEKPAMRPLPSQPYVLGLWKKARVHLDYHIEVDGHYYSVPFTLVGQLMEVKLTDTVVEIFYLGRRVFSYRRSYERGRATTMKEHMPPNHQKMVEWTPERIVSWAGKIGPATRTVVTEIMARRQYPQQGFRACMGLLHLSGRLGKDRLEAAAARAVAFSAYSYKSVKSILEKGLDREPLPESLARPAVRTAGQHENVRGAHYYAKEVTGQS